MSLASDQQATRLTLVTAPGCHFCEDAQQAIAALIQHGAAIDLEVVEATSPAGLTLLGKHRPAMNPLVLVDGVYFSAGRLPRRKLESLLKQQAAGPKMVVSRG